MKGRSLLLLALAVASCGTAFAAEANHKMDDCCPEVAAQLVETNSHLALIQSDLRASSEQMDTKNMCYYEGKAYTEGAARNGQVCSRIINTQPVQWVTRS
ncbi:MULTISPECIES: hypothetical protein [unclassified Dyella]|uniref:hypothetical protein n=1 Tax=Dyella sp. ASV21 TaxID=2795114 RepID=UPI0018EB600E|nr:MULTISPECIES: hypothetical protein [unclassified Dyella]